MISYVLLLSHLACPDVSVINHTKVWNKTDEKMLQTARSHCEVEYKDSPCMKIFEKIRDQEYRVLCTYKREAP